MRTFSLRRIRILSVALLLAALVLIGKLYMVQIVQEEAWSNRANRQYARPTNTLFDRGSIYFETKGGDRIAAATIKEGYTIVVIPKDIENATSTFDAVSAIIPLERDIFLAKALKKDDPYEEIAKRVDPEKSLAIDALNIPGVRIYKDRWRVYPDGTLAAHTVGFVGYNNDNTLMGRYGLERTYESVLGRDTENLYVNFFAEIFTDISKKVKGEDLEGNIITSIEPTVEAFIENQLKSLSTRYSPEVSGAIVINPKTGSIYAMAGNPSFDSNTFNIEKNPGVWSNPLVENVYEMGSIMKPLTMAAGIESGKITPKTTYKDEGFLILDNKRISNFDGKGRGITTMQQVINESLNTGVAFAVSRMGKDYFADMMLNFGLGEQTGIDLPNEAKGLVDNLKTRRDVEAATAAYGQGIAMSPINIVRALGAIANGGVLVRPHVAQKIEYSGGLSKTIEPEIGRRVVKTESAEEVTRMLVTAVDTALLGGKAKMEHYSIAAKTGTAQVADPKKGGYYEDQYLHSFFGYFPAYNPQFLVFLFMKHPKDAGFASETLVTPFVDITKFLINYYQIPPDR